MRFKFSGLNITDMGVGVIVTINIPPVFKKSLQTLFSGFKNGDEFDIVRYKKKRSLDANAYFWKLASELAIKLGISKEEVYKQAILNAGKYEVLCAFDTKTKKAKDVAESFCNNWRKNGLGWIAYQDKIRPEIMYIYYGSSGYKSDEFSRLIDWITEECQQQGIETRPKEEVDSLLKQWEQKYG